MCPTLSAWIALLRPFRLPAAIRTNSRSNDVRRTMPDGNATLVRAAPARESGDSTARPNHAPADNNRCYIEFRISPEASSHVRAGLCKRACAQGDADSRPDIPATATHQEQLSRKVPKSPAYAVSLAHQFPGSFCPTSESRLSHPFIAPHAHQLVPQVK